MSSAVKISDDLLENARIYAKTFHRSAAGQIEYWAKIGRLAEENPELPFHFIQGILLSLEVIIVQTALFGKQKKKLHENQVTALDQAVKHIVEKPLMGALKKGDLQGVRVYKFKIVAQEYLLAYVETKKQITLLTVGTHENFIKI